MYRNFSVTFAPFTFNIHFSLHIATCMLIKQNAIWYFDRRIEYYEDVFFPCFRSRLWITLASSIRLFRCSISERKQQENRVSKQIYSHGIRKLNDDTEKMTQLQRNERFSIKIFIVPTKKSSIWIEGKICIWKNCATLCENEEREKKRTKDNTFLISRLTGKVAPSIHPKSSSSIM